MQPPLKHHANPHAKPLSKPEPTLLIPQANPSQPPKSQAHANPTPTPLDPHATISEVPYNYHLGGTISEAISEALYHYAIPLPSGRRNTTWRYALACQPHGGTIPLARNPPQTPCQPSEAPYHLPAYPPLLDGMHGAGMRNEAEMSQDGLSQGEQR